MQMPKLLWLKTHRADLWAEVTRVSDLPDWLVSRASGEDKRSLCSVVCKAGSVSQHQPPSPTEILC